MLYCGDSVLRSCGIKTEVLFAGVKIWLRLVTLYASLTTATVSSQLRFCRSSRENLQGLQCVLNCVAPLSNSKPFSTKPECAAMSDVSSNLFSLLYKWGGGGGEAAAVSYKKKSSEIRRLCLQRRRR